MRPRKVRRLLAAIGVGGCVAAAALGIITPKAEAVPGQCGQGFAFGSGGGWCDSMPAADGTWTHCETVYVLGFGGTNCFRVRPVPIEVDPRGWSPV